LATIRPAACLRDSSGDVDGNLRLADTRFAGHEGQLAAREPPLPKPFDVFGFDFIHTGELQAGNGGGHRLRRGRCRIWRP
jgi:hypothetical protein